MFAHAVVPEAAGFTQKQQFTINFTHEPIIVA
jgi:hypothetical protein